ncbi:MAG: alpha/beta fold hydrolase [Chitinophagaceae bacterium]|nr:MAG: alpha/beta fold hydrolase [Chitinophagaceae bacterium]
MHIWILFVLLLLAAPSSAQTEGYAPTNGLRTYYRSFGQGAPVLIINGGPGISSEGFAEIAQLLSKNNRTLIYDQRGTGRSVLVQKDASTITMAFLADDLEQLRKHLGYEQWIVMGHSFGGMLASYYAAHYPDRVKALILSSSGGIDMDLFSGYRGSVYERLTQTEADSLRYWEGVIARGDTATAARFGRARSLACAYVYNRKYAPMIAARLVQTDQKLNALVWQDLRRIRFNCAPQLKQFTKPVLILQGRNDIIDTSAAVKAHRVLRNSRLVLLNHCGHYGWLDQREIYLSEVYAFLKSVN